MTVVRVLVMKGDEKWVKGTLERCVARPERSFTPGPGRSITEVYRTVSEGDEAVVDYESLNEALESF